MNSGRLIKNLLREDVEDASKLLGLAINKTQEQLFANLDYELNSSEFIKFLSLVDERKMANHLLISKALKASMIMNFLYLLQHLFPDLKLNY